MTKTIHAAAMAAALAASIAPAVAATGADDPAATAVPAFHLRAPADEAGTADHKRPKFHVRYQGGPVMTGANAVYAIYYGDFPLTGARNDSRAILDDFLTGMGGTSIFAVNSTYTDGAGTPVPRTLAYDRATHSALDAYSLGPQPTNAEVPLIVAEAIHSGRLPLDDDGVYVVFVSPDATRHLQTCAFHHWSTDIMQGHVVKWASVPLFTGKDMQRCSGSLHVYGESNSPNDNIEADTAIDSAFHEVSEALTDPEGTGWVSDDHGVENGDPCTFNYGPGYVAPNGTHANANFGGRDYLFQTLWISQQPVRCAYRP